MTPDRDRPPGAVRTGLGFDVHPFAADRVLVLGGVRIDHAEGLIGHSDADVVLHAIADALLGAASLGDIGTHFPPDDPTWAGADSRELLAAVAERVRRTGLAVAHVDATVVAERPRIAPHVAAMREAIAAAIGVGVERTSVKATTAEGLGFVGRVEGIAALAIATVVEVGAGEDAGENPCNTLE